MNLSLSALPTHIRFCRSVVTAAGLLCAWLLAPELLCQGFDGAFESPQVSWRLAESDCAFRATAHERRLGEAHRGRGCEFLRIAAGHGTYVYIVHDLPPATVIKELSANVWVKSPRAGIQLLLRAVLPRSLDPETKKPFTVLLAGDSYFKLDHWQQLNVADVDTLLERQVRLLRAKFGPEVDAREAFVDLAVVNVYGGAGTTEIWLDDLELQGEVAASAADATSSHSTPENSGVEAIKRVQFEELPADTASPGPARSRQPASVAGGILHADGKPLYPVVVESNGEPLSFLKSLGCNAVRLKTPATQSQMRDADLLDLWLIAPPPDAATKSIDGDRFNSVLAWDLGEAMVAERLTLASQSAHQARRIDARAHRPLICETRDLLDACSREADIVVARRALWGSPLGLSEYRQFLTQAHTQVRAGTPVWASIPTEPSSELLSQWSAWGFAESMPAIVEPDQIRAAVYAAILGGARGIIFSSRTRLDSETVDARMRAEAIELAARELESLSPWLASGGVVTPVVSGNSNYMASTLHHDRGEMMLVLSASPSQQFSVAPSATGRPSFVLPALSESMQAYRVLDGGVQPLRASRVTGGMRIEIADPGLVSLVLLTQDASVIHAFSQRLAESALRRAGLEHNLVAARIPLVANIDALGPSPALASPTRTWIDDALTNAEQAQRLLTAGDARGATRFCARANDSLARVQRHHWEQAARGFPFPGASPCVASFWSLPLHWQAVGKLTDARFENNLLPTGNVENLAAMVEAGWSRSNAVPGQTTTTVELSGTDAREGAYCLRLAADGAPLAPHQAAVWVASPQLPIRVGTVLRIHGWARQAPSEGKPNDATLVVYDSWMGPEYGIRFRGTGEWREFTLYRAAPRSETFQLVVALEGLGEARLDALTITGLSPSGGNLVNESAPLTFGPPPLEGPRRN